MKIKILFLSILFILVLSFNLVLAQEKDKEGSGIEIGYNFSFWMAANEGTHFNFEEPNLNLTGRNIMISFPIRPNFRLSLGSTSASRDWSYYVWSIFGDSETRYYSTRISGTFFEITRRWDPFFTQLRTFHKTWHGELTIGMRINSLYVYKYAGEDYVDPIHSDSESEFSGHGYRISIPIELKTPMQFNKNILVNAALIPGYWNIPIEGTINGTPSSHRLSGFNYYIILGLSLRI